MTLLCYKIYIIKKVTFFFSMFFISLVFLFSFSECSSKIYSIMVDCGSSGTRVHIYYWKKTDDVPNIQSPEPKSESNFDIDLKLSDAADNETIITIIGRTIIEKCTPLIPFKYLHDTALFMYATAGLRLLPENAQKKILNDMYLYMKQHSKFIVNENRIRVISGSEEGLFGWLSINYMLSNFFNDANLSASIDMGGASTEVAFQVDSKNVSKNVLTVRIGHEIFNVFSYSYLYYGSDSALETVNKYVYNSSQTDSSLSNPCYFKDYNFSYNNKEMIGTGDVDQCSNIIRQNLFNAENFTNISIPSMDQVKSIYAISTFAYALSFLNISTSTSLKEFRKALDDVAALDINEIYEKYKDSGINKKYIPTYFWQSTYGLCFLQSLNLTDDLHTFEMPQTLNGDDFGWALGAMVKEVYDVQLLDDDNPYLVPISASALAIIGIIIMVMAYLTRINPNSSSQLVSISSISTV